MALTQELTQEAKFKISASFASQHFYHISVFLMMIVSEQQLISYRFMPWQRKPIGRLHYYIKEDAFKTFSQS